MMMMMMMMMMMQLIFLYWHIEPEPLLPHSTGSG